MTDPIREALAELVRLFDERDTIYAKTAGHVAFAAARAALAAPVAQPDDDNAMLLGVLRMPYELAMSTELSRRQFYERAQEAADIIAAPVAQPLTERIAELEQALSVYADPSFYHACGFMFDRPTGGFDEDFDFDGEYGRLMPGKLARATLGIESTPKPPTDEEIEYASWSKP
jgi:hypothetical protein